MKFQVAVQMGLLRWSRKFMIELCEFVESCGDLKLVDEQDLALNAWKFVRDVTKFDCSDRLEPAQG